MTKAQTKPSLFFWIILSEARQLKITCRALLASMFKNKVALFVVFLLFSHLASAQTLRPTTFDNRNICEESKGIWRQFGNGCADTCEAKFDKFVMCTQALVYSCECGKNRCWNGEACLALKDYKKTYDIEVEKNQKILDAAKEKRKAEALANEQQIMAKLNPQDPNAPKPAEVLTPKKPEPIIIQPAAVNSQNPAQVSAPIQAPIQAPSNIATTPASEIKNPELPKTEAKQVEIPPFLLKKQAQEEAKKNEEKEKSAALKKAEESKNIEEKKKSEESKSLIIKNPVPPGLPVIPLPN